MNPCTIPWPATRCCRQTSCRGLQVIEADAGTGKTWTIARLVLRALLETDWRIEQMAVLTFTKAAAGELKARIGGLIDQWVNDDPSLHDDPFFQRYASPHDSHETRARLRLARLTLDEAQITTIHGFCHRLLSDNALSLGRWDEIEPSADTRELLDGVLTDWWREHLGAAQAGTQWLVGRHGLARQTLLEAVTRLHGNPQARIWWQGRPGHAAPGDWRTLGRRLEQAVARLREEIAAEESALIDWFARTSALNRQSYGEVKNRQRLGWLKEWVGSEPVDLDVDGKVLRAFDARKMVAAYRKNQPLEHHGFGLFEAIRQLNDLLVERAELNEAIAIEILPAFSQAVRERERSSRQMGFDSLLLATAGALDDDARGEQLAARLRQCYPLALVDEFQDTDPVQWRIFEAIYRPGGSAVGECADGTALILVGDPKQAIYSFRQADVHTYLRAVGLSAARHRLDHNQRSGGGLIGAVNGLITRPDPFAVPQFGFSGARPGHKASLPRTQPPDDGLGAMCLVTLTDRQDLDKTRQPFNKALVGERAVRTTVTEIARLLRTPGAGVQPADVAVLVRTAAQGVLLKRALGGLGIGAVEINRNSVFGSDEAGELQRLLAALAAPRDQALVRGAVLTLVLGADAARGVDAAGQARWAQALEALARCRLNWQRAGSALALRHLLLLDFERAGALAAMPSGERRLTNLLHLFELLEAAPQARQTPEQALAWLGRQRADANRSVRGNDETQMRLESDEALVRIVTIHASKGLEFPIVFLPFLWEARRPRLSTMASCQAPGDGVPVRWLAARAPKGPLDSEVIAERCPVGGRAAVEDAAEALRLAYVALTRAVRRVYVFWGSDSTETKTRKGVVKPAPLGYWLDPASDLVEADQSNSTGQGWPRLDAIEARIAALVAGGSVGHRHHDAMPALPPGRAPTQITDAVPLPLAVPARLPPVAWGRRSFSSLVQGAETTIDRPDHDESAFGLRQRAVRDSDNADEAATGEGPVERTGSRNGANDDIRHGFTRGANAGTCLHDMFERHDFRAPFDVDMVGRSLARYGLDPAQAGRVGRWLDEVLQAPLGPPECPWSLRALERGDTLRELPFTLSAGQLQAQAMVEAIAREHPLALNLAEPPWRGFLNGFVDLVARVDGRYWIVDYKSNWLGPDVSQYHRDALERSVREHHYALQYSLYTLAVHRWLGRRLHDYDYDRHIGGVCYLFLRGAGPGAAGLPEAPGVYRQRCSRELIDTLDDLLGPGLPWPAAAGLEAAR
ncbi:MAG: UvrD-helicase domain-containing protein [Burkholderiaceae bacterium]